MEFLDFTYFRFCSLSALCPKEQKLIKMSRRLLRGKLKERSPLSTIQDLAVFVKKKPPEGGFFIN
jgi:hypothetical protein